MLCAAAASSLLACVPPVRAPPSVVASGLRGPPGTTLAQACTPTGPELCFNAVDDNCNGVIDEGCGLPTGVLQFTVAWQGAADVDLVLTTPSGERVPDGRTRSTSSGFHLDRACPADGCGGQDIDNIHFDGEDPPRGHYAVTITLGDLHGATPPVTVHFGARIGARTVGFDANLAAGEDAKKVFEFDL